jgi:selenide,water dikinase
MKDVEKRKRVMARSMQLGHCICDHRKTCPCDILLEKDICPCAGEKVDGRAEPVRLMELVDSAGCASKIDQATLNRVLGGLPFPDDPRVLVGAPAGDDAGVYKLNDDTALVQTVDVFTPSVDDPYVFGQIAAANSLSDVYAMGARPITALSIVGFPIRTVPDHAMHEILRGGVDKMREAGVAVIGGHSINDKEVKAGFAVTGLVHPDRIVTNAGARPGDRLILTKPLGTGIIAFAAQIGRAPAEAPEASARSMAALNDTASKLMIELGAHAATDVTGFGLMGHLAAMAAASKVDVEIVWDDLPVLPGVLQCLADGIASGAVERNRESSGHCLAAGENVRPDMLDLCFDPQTSGGLLIAAAQSAAESLLKRLHATGIAEAAIIGKVVSAGTGRVLLRSDGRRQLPARRPAAVTPISQTSQEVSHKDRIIAEESNNMSCCEEHHGSDPSTTAAPGGATATEQQFHDFLRASAAPGALDGKTKQVVAVALSVLARCEPCVKSNVKKARQMGLSQQQIDEAAWMGIAFGGSPAMAFYNALKKADN